MKAELTCAIARDLLPSYVDGLTAPETNEAVEAHLAACPDCAARMAAMKTPEPSPSGAQAEAADREVDYLKKVRRLSRQRMVLAAVCTALVLLAGAAMKLFFIGVPAPEESVAITSAYQEGSVLYLQFTSLASGMDFRDWTITEEDGILSVTARQVLLSPISPKERELTVPLSSDTREVRVCGRLVWQDGMIFAGAEGGIVDLWEARTPYVGNASALGRLAVQLDLEGYFGPFTSSLQTSAQPYRWTLEFKNAPSYTDDIMPFYAMQMLALVGNLEEVGWTYTDGNGVLHTHVVTLSGADALLPALTEQYNAACGTDWTPLAGVKDYAASASTLRQLYNLSWQLVQWETPVWTGEDCCQ